MWGAAVARAPWLVLAALALLVRSSQATVEVMKDVTLGFGEALQHCREESQLTEEKMEEFFHFWREDFRFEHRELGCAIKCMSHHFNLLTDSHRMHHDNTHQFIKSFPNGELLAAQMVAIIHDCEKAQESEEDHCWRILRVAECFKHTCTQRGLAPSMEVLMAEFIMEAEAR
ncbi:general odorant-binding protein 1-like [Pectinophora gossypiella]|uniref:general odorant-binding protein 1-like n=1 Tax=Pectinophora gossypiella TaxID=13191 RepID=UPI00214EB11F|nr:general odorant-binding protein 1-like [Pectinophora gossypiella]